MIALAAGVVLCAPLVFRAQVSIPARERAASSAPDGIPRPDLRIDRTEVLIPVAVNDVYNRPVAGLEQENFRVFDDKVEQAITSFSMEDEPVAVASGIRHQRQHERSRARGAHGRDRIFQDRESRG